ncbi:MAG TPA: O-antigen ligase family protein [Verrucomicrobiae bacterium]|nr:O-antigen ligase family protein [Verrucomicrobiae bacterium]
MLATPPSFRPGGKNTKTWIGLAPIVWTSKLFAALLKTGGVAFLFFVLLFADGVWATFPGFIGSALRDLTAVCRESGTQWMLVFCLVCYHGVFLFLERRARSDTPYLRFSNPNVWLGAFILAVLLRYALTYETAMQSMQIPVLMAGIVFGKAISMWVGFSFKHRHLTPALSPIEAEREKMRRTFWIIGLLVCLLAGSALWQPESGISFSYHGIQRWSGVWDNPNFYGLLMGTGCILTIGQIFGMRRWKMEDGAGQVRAGIWRLASGKCAIVCLCLVAAILTGYGLFKSYSRGAWLGTACGLAYLAIAECRMRSAELMQAGKCSCSSCISWLKKNRLSLVVVLLSVAVLGFWQLRFSESRPAQRLFSVGNLNDFSWRNRVTAWEGAARMMVDRPWTGFGWGQAETDYGKKYLPSRLNESAAIEMNDYLMIGISAGVPAMICFGMYLWLSLKPKYTSPHPDPLPSLLERRGDIQATCRAGALVLLVGFWFDGGLFKLPIATVFWTLIELSRIKPEFRIQNSEARSLNQSDILEIRNPQSSIHNQTWPRWLAGILAVLAAAQTIVYLGTPLFPVGHGTLAIAWKCLIQRNEADDFEFLSANAVWRGQKLKVLLEHLRLANYNRQLINWQLDDNMYRDYVLSPVIEPSTLNSSLSATLEWRRLLWEEFYPRIRHESSLEEAAKVVMHHLCARVTIVVAPSLAHDVPDIWLKQITDAAGFEIVYVAALRSVGIPARLDSINHADFWDGNKWQAAPAP